MPKYEYADPDDACYFDMTDLERDARRPKCSICGNTIYEEKAARLNGEWICDDCLDDARESTEID